MSGSGNQNSIIMSEAEKRRQRTRSIAIGCGLAALVVLFYCVTLVRMGADVFNRPL